LRAGKNPRQRDLQRQFGRLEPCLPSAAKRPAACTRLDLMTRDEVRRIAVNIAKLPGLLGVIYF